MKKIYTYVVSALTCCSINTVMAQDQLLNSNFENWEQCSQTTIWVSDGPTNGVEPQNWNSFISACSSFSTMPTLFMFGQDQLRRSPDVRPGSNGINSAYIFSTEILGIVANGNLTTGAIHMGSMIATDESNYNFTDLRSDTINVGTPFVYDPSLHRVSFNGRPDSIVVWSKFTPVQESKPSGDNVIINEAQFSFILHDAVSYKEPHATAEEREAALVADAYITTPSTKNQWVRFSKSIDYHKTIQPSYLLASFTTNKIPGSGKGGDQLWIDDMRFIYNSKLRSVAIGEELIPEFDEDTYDYIIATPTTGVPSIETIEAKPFGNNATVNKTIVDNNKIIITVTDETAKGEKTRVYTLLFVEAPQTTFTLTLPNEISYGSVISPEITGLPIDAEVDYEFDKPALLTKDKDGNFIASGAGEITIKAIYRENGKPIIYSNSHKLNILPLPLYVSAEDIKYKRGASLPTYKFKYEGLLSEDTLILSNVFIENPSATSEVEKTSLPGSKYPITLFPGEAYNYTMITRGEAFVTVVKPTLTIEAKNLSRGEGKENPELTYSYRGFVNNENQTTEGVITSLPIISCEAGADAKAGEKYDIIVSGAATELYDISYKNGVLSIKKNPGDIAVDEYTVSYGEEPFSIIATGAYEGANYRFYPVDSKIVSIESASGLATIKGAGKTDVKIKLSETSEYMGAPDFVTTVNVGKAPLTIEAVNCERLIGEDNPLFDLAYDGFVYGETPETVFDVLPVATCDASNNSSAGDYEIKVNPVTANNYDVKTKNGIMTVKVADGIGAVDISGVRVIAVKNELRILDNNELNVVRIFDAGGRLIKESTQETTVCNVQPAAFYVVCVGEKVFKVIVSE